MDDVQTAEAERVRKAQPHPIARHPRIKNGYLYRGLAVGPGTMLHEALENRDRKRADKLYDAQKEAFVEQYGQEFWDRLQ
jgi:hypothetical protein